MEQETIMVISGHADDPVVGLGGSLARYASEGYRVISVVFSYGERSVPYVQKDIIKDKVLKESKKADKIIGGSGVIFLGLRSGHFTEDFSSQNADTALERIISKYRPIKIFTHSSDDSHPDHRSVNKLVLETLDRMEFEQSFVADVYGFGVWRLFRFNKRKYPFLVVDVSLTFNKKLRAITAFRSQNIRLFVLRLGVYLSALRKGLKHDSVFVEEFQKLR